LPKVHGELIGAINLGSTRRNLFARKLSNRVTQRYEIIRQTTVQFD
jgi:hypothetical protein